MAISFDTPEQHVEIALEGGIFSGLLTPTTGQGIISPQIARMADTWLEKIIHLDGSEEVLGYAHEDARPSWLTGDLSPLSDSLDGKKRYDYELTIDEANWDIENVKVVWVGMEIRNPIPHLFAVPYVPSTLTWDDAFSTAFVPASDAIFFWQGKGVSDTQIADPYKILSETSPYNLRIQSPGTPIIEPISGLFNGHKALNFASEGFSTGQLAISDGQRLYWGSGSAYAAVIMAAPAGDSYSWTYGHMPFVQTTNQRPNDTVRFQATEVFDPYYGGNLSTLDLPRDTAMLVEFIYAGNGTYTAFINRQEAFTITPENISYPITLYPRYGGRMYLASYYALDRAPTSDERQAFADLAVLEYGVTL